MLQLNIKHAEGKFTLSGMYKEVDWLMGEAGRLSEITSAKPMVGKDTQLITFLALWNGIDATTAVPEALAEGVGLYGFAKPTSKDGTINLERILPKQLSELSGDSKNIAVLARAYHGKSIDSVWTGDTFFEAYPPPFRIEFRSRKGWSDTARITHENDKSVISIRNPYQSGRGRLTRVGEKWPSSIVIQLLRKNPDIAGPSHFRIANGNLGVWISQTGATKVVAAKFEGALDLQNAWTAGKFLNGGNPESPITLKRVETKNTDEAVVIEVPKIIIESNPDTLVFEWCNGEKVR